jgi:hypothetical protein
MRLVGVIIIFIVLCVFKQCIISVTACPCDTASLRSSLDDLRSSINAAHWNMSASRCTWLGVICTNALTSLSLCAAASHCVNGTLPSSFNTWRALGRNLTSLTINGVKLVGPFPTAVSSSLPALIRLAFISYTPTGEVQLPHSALGYSLSITSLSNITVVPSAPEAAVNVTSLIVASSTVPDVSNITSLSSITINGGTLGTLHWTHMTSLTSISVALLKDVTALPNWTGIDFPALTSILLASMSGLTAIPASWSSILTLTTISVSTCAQITSPLPSEWSNLTNLRSISIATTPMTGPLPDTWGKLINTTIAVAGANFSGATLPPTWASGATFTSLRISSSSLGGPLPQWPSNTALTYLSLPRNSITGPLPTTVTGWGLLTYLDLSGNPINSTLPDWSPMTSLATFLGSSCGIVGPLPLWGSESSPMSSLHTISIANNFINESIPVSWGLMPRLATLDASTSSIVGQLPLTWSSTSLTSLSLQGNSLSGSLTGLTFNSSGFVALDLSSNRIGPSCSFIVPVALRTLLLNDNLCVGPHPSWATATILTTVDLAGNTFTGSLASIPSARLQTLRVDRGNRFTGPLPSWTSATALTEVAASNNQFSGTLPAFSSSARPTTLLFAANNLSGTFPPGAVLSSLQFLDLSANSFTGPLPLLNAATALRQLNVSLNNFTGPLALAASLPSLTLLDVACNSLSGTLPSWGSSRSLAHVNLSCGNAFSGSLPAFSPAAYSSLSSLDISDQGLTGVLASILGSTLSSGAQTAAVTSMLLGGNSLTGTMPQFLRWPSLQRFNASGNSLTGSIAVASGSSFPASLWSIDVSNNGALSGTVPVPSGSSTVFTQLRHYLLGGNAHNFSGSLPPLNAIFPNLSRFSLSGSFPVTVPYAWFVGPAAWANLTTLSVRKCGFSGTFPAPLAGTLLTLLDLSCNRLNGSLPADLPTYAPLLATLDVSDNGFTGQLPAAWSSLTSLMRLDAHSCQLSGAIPATLPPALESLLLWNNSLVSPSPDSDSTVSWASYTRLQHLDISSNRLTSLPVLSSGTALTVLNISNNSISPSTLPVSWGVDIESIVALNVSRNKFTGGIPTEWTTTTSLRFLRSLDASSNQLDGSSTPLVSLLNNSAFPFLQVLHLQQNKITGTLDDAAIGNALIDVDLSNNNLSGGLPSGLFANAGNVVLLKFGQNQLNSSLPKAWGLYSTAPPASLELLNISHNLISGHIPYTWGDIFRRPHFAMDLCGNIICGPVPMTLADFPDVGFARCAETPLVHDKECFSPSSTLSMTAPLSFSNSQLTPSPPSSLTPSTLPSPSPSTTATRSISASASESYPQIALANTSADAFVAAVKDLTATASALTSLLSAADISNVNTLMLMSYVDCRVGDDKSIDSMRDGSFSSYMISPLMDVGWAAVAWGNLSLGLLALALNAVATAAAAMMDSRRRRELDDRSDLPAPPPLSFVDALRAAVCGDVRAPAAFPAFPAIGIRFVELWTSGSVLGAFAELSAAARASSAADNAPRYATGVLAMLSCVGVLAGWQLVLIHKVLPHTTFVDYQLQALRENPLAVPSWAPQWLLPVGSWQPPTVRNKFDQQFTQHDSKWAAKCRILLHFGLSCVSSLLTAASFVSPAACEVSCVLLAIIYFASAAFVARFVLYRCRFNTPLAVVVFALLGVQCSLQAAKEPVPSWIPLLQTLLTILRSTLRIFSSVLERGMETLTVFGQDGCEDEKLASRRLDTSGSEMIRFENCGDDDDDDSGEIGHQVPVPPVNDEAADGDEMNVCLDVPSSGDEFEVDPGRVVNPINDIVIVGAAVTTLDVAPSKRSALRGGLAKTRLVRSRLRDQNDLERHFANIGSGGGEPEDEESPLPPTPPSSPDLDDTDQHDLYNMIL